MAALLAARCCVHSEQPALLLLLLLPALSHSIAANPPPARPQAWDANSLACLRTLEGHEDNVRVLAVGHGHLFSGSWDKTVRVRARRAGGLPALLLAAAGSGGGGGGSL